MIALADGTASLDVATLPRRVAHATHALLEASREHGMPVTAQEIVIYDAEALSARGTAAALREARKLGLASYVAATWIPAISAYELRRPLEDRFLADTADEHDS